MKEDIKKLFPEWVNDDERGKYVVCLSDDLDSLVGTSILKQVKGYEIKHFYSFDNFYSADKDKRKAIGVDIAIMNGMTWDNHITMLSQNDAVNEQSANLNAIFRISRDNYTKKYAGSTCLTMWAYYNLPLPSTDEGKLLLLSIDSTYKGHYINNFKNIQNSYLQMLGMEELIEVQDKYTQKHFINIKKQCGAWGKINFQDGQLQTSMDLDKISELLEMDINLPEHDFYHKRNLSRMKSALSVNVHYDKNKVEKKLQKEIFSLALTKRDEVNLTFKN